jgi:hypothetical protein
MSDELEVEVAKKNGYCTTKQTTRQSEEEQS